MTDPEEKKLYWLVRSSGGDPVILGFVRNDQSGGLVIKGPTGTHCTGHSEGWRSKWRQILADGFEEVAHAQQLGILPQDWKPPGLSRQERRLLEVFTS